MLPRRYSPEMGLAVCAGYTLLQNTMRIIRFDFEKKKDLFFLAFYELNDVTVSCFSECGMMTWVQSDLYGETLRFFLFNNLLKTLHLPPIALSFSIFLLLISFSMFLAFLISFHPVLNFKILTMNTNALHGIYRYLVTC